MPEGEIFRRRVGVLVLAPLAVAFCLAHAHKTEGVERARVGVDRVVEVHRARRRGDESALGDERAVRERDVFEDLAVKRD